LPRAGRLESGRTGRPIIVVTAFGAVVVGLALARIWLATSTARKRGGSCHFFPDDGIRHRREDVAAARLRPLEELRREGQSEKAKAIKAKAMRTKANGR